MKPIKLKLNDQQRGAFLIEEGDEKLAEMVIAVIGPRLIVYHTEVAEKLRGQGIADKLIDEMVSYARSKALKVVPLCSYVLGQFKHNTDLYADIWDKNWKDK